MVVDVRAKCSDFGTPRGGYPRSSHHAGAGAGKCWHIRRIIAAERTRGEMVQVFSGSRLFGGCSSRSRSPELGGGHFCPSLLCGTSPNGRIFAAVLSLRLLKP